MHNHSVSPPLRPAGEAEDDGYQDEYQLEDLEVSPSDYVRAEAVPNFRAVWEELGEESEMADSYGLGTRDSIQEAVEAVVATLGMQVRVWGRDIACVCKQAWAKLCAAPAVCRCWAAQRTDGAVLAVVGHQLCLVMASATSQAGALLVAG